MADNTYTFTDRAVKKIVEVVKDYEGQTGDTTAPVGVKNAVFSRRRIDAKITGSTVDGSGRYSYSFSQVSLSAVGYGNWTVVSGGITGTAYNRGEDLAAGTAVATNTIVSVDMIPYQDGSGNWLFSFWFGNSLGGLTLLWGKVISNWTSGNTTTVHPCNQDGTGVVSGTTVALYLFAPITYTPKFPQIAADDIIPYVMISSIWGLAIGIVDNGLPVGTQQYQLSSWDNTNKKWIADWARWH